MDFSEDIKQEVKRIRQIHRDNWKISVYLSNEDNDK